MSGRLEDETEYIKLQDFAAGVYFICLYTEERREALVFLVD
jgi:hypothetical protein